MSYHVNIIRLKAVSNILSEFKEQLVFVGGATVCLYASRPELTSIRPTDASILGFTNRWYEEAIRYKVKAALDEQSSLYIFSAPYFVASKMEAFLGRGKGDLFASHDLEDIVYVLDNRLTMPEEIIAAPVSVRTYLSNQFTKLANRPLFKEALLGHVEQQNAMERVKRIMELITGLK